MQAVDYSPEKAKAYSRLRQILMLVHLVYAPAVIVLVIVTGWSVLFKEAALERSVNPYGALFYYFFIYSAVTAFLEFPFSIYSGYFLEKSFSLTNQTLRSWAGTYLKKTALGFVVGYGLVSGLYALIWNFPERWWLLAWAGFAMVSYIFGKLFPVLVVPMFYKYGQVENEEVKELIRNLADRYKLPLSQIYSLNLSKTTKKANAAFMGLGKTKRVVLSDTLLAHFTPREIEAVVAHELGHCKHGDIWKQLVVGLVTSFIGFKLVDWAIPQLSGQLGFEGAGDIAALPLIFLVFYLFQLALTPFQNGFSRMVEKDADLFAFKACNNPRVFMDCLEKLGRVNLAERDPNPVYEWFFYDHPSIGRRVEFIKGWMGGGK